MTNPLRQLGELKKMRDQAMQIQRTLKNERIELDEGGIKIVLNGQQEILELEIDGEKNDKLKDKLNKALKTSQEIAAKKLQQMSGGLQGLLGNLGQ
ncbi:YbaB/EbfC family DNA-binding protein [Candidatus Microgenomates bacterium]|jgi:DNA-binding protein YbaB|nr:MAG: YbaB/EbfC family DNA-binding protein [Candidatus Microgenomates bacterium]